MIERVVRATGSTDDLEALTPEEMDMISTQTRTQTDDAWYSAHLYIASERQQAIRRRQAIIADALAWGITIAAFCAVGWMLDVAYRMWA